MTDKFHTISKLDAAKRQLEAFIRMYFHFGDMVSMHTLVGAAFGIIADINQKRGGSPTFHDALIKRVKPEYVKEVQQKLNEAQNFFKHADRDHDSTLEFNPSSTELMAMDACMKYLEITGENPPLFKIYHGWMMILRDQVYILPEDQRAQILSAAKTFLPTGRTAYFNDMLPVVMKGGT